MSNFAERIKKATKTIDELGEDSEYEDEQEEENALDILTKEDRPSTSGRSTGSKKTHDLFSSNSNLIEEIDSILCKRLDEYLCHDEEAKTAILIMAAKATLYDRMIPEDITGDTALSLLKSSDTNLQIISKELRFEEDDINIPDYAQGQDSEVVGKIAGIIKGQKRTPAADKPKPAKEEKKVAFSSSKTSAPTTSSTRSEQLKSRDDIFSMMAANPSK
jgi:hypothetical protein